MTAVKNNRNEARQWLMLSLAVRIARGIIVTAFFLLGLCFLVQLATKFVSLGPLNGVGEAMQPASRFLFRIFAIQDPMWDLPIIMLLAFFSFFLQQLNVILLGNLAKKFDDLARGPAEKKIEEKKVEKPTEEQIKKVKESILRSYSEESKIAKDSIAFAKEAPDSEKEREELLKQYWKIEMALKSASQKNCVFLSADVVGSTKMKVAADETAVKATFHAYEQMLKKIFADHGAWKQAWTPDGVMICFLDRNLAVGAAKLLLGNLERFNTTFNKLGTKFQVRCGMNEGDVAIFEDSQLERVADRVIDVAGHMQKYAPEDTLLISEHLFQKLSDKSGFTLSGKTVDGYTAWEWRP